VGKDDCNESSSEKRSARRRAEEKFVEDLVTRGEAIEPDERGDLPGGATHEIVEEREGELPKVSRRRFTAS